MSTQKRPNQPSRQKSSKLSARTARTPLIPKADDPVSLVSLNLTFTPEAQRRKF